MDYCNDTPQQAVAKAMIGGRSEPKSVTVFVTAEASGFTVTYDGKRHAFSKWEDTVSFLAGAFGQPSAAVGFDDVAQGAVNTVVTADDYDWRVRDNRISALHHAVAIKPLMTDRAFFSIVSDVENYIKYGSPTPPCTPAAEKPETEATDNDTALVSRATRNQSL